MRLDIRVQLTHRLADKLNAHHPGGRGIRIHIPDVSRLIVVIEDDLAHDESFIHGVKQRAVFLLASRSAASARARSSASVCREMMMAAAWVTTAPSARSGGEASLGSRKYMAKVPIGLRSRV